MRVTLLVAIPATMIAMVLGTAGGWLLAQRRGPVSRLLEALLLLPLVLPPTALGYYLLVLIGRRGPVGQAWEFLTGGPLAFTPLAAILAVCVTAIPLVARPMIAAFQALDRELLDQATMDGASAWSLFLEVQLPLVRPALVAGTSLAFARCVGDFGVTLMVAGNIPGRTQTASLAIYDALNGGHDGRALALVAVVSLLCILVILLGSSWRRE